MGKLLPVHCPLDMYLEPLLCAITVLGAGRTAITAYIWAYGSPWVSLSNAHEVRLELSLTVFMKEKVTTGLIPKTACYGPKPLHWQLLSGCMPL